METLYRNATNRVLFRLREDPARFLEAAVIFRQGGRVVLSKRKGELSVEEEPDTNGGRCWIVGVDITPEESRRLAAGRLCLAQIVALTDGDVQEPGEIVEFDVCDTLADICLKEGTPCR